MTVNPAYVLAGAQAASAGDGGKIDLEALGLGGSLSGTNGILVLSGALADNGSTQATSSNGGAK